MSKAADILARLEHFGIRLGLETTRQILAELGEPQRGLAVVLVAGTNGKGSTAALLQSMSRAAGYRTGFYSSPHLEGPTERIRVDGEAIGEARLGDLLAGIVAAGERRNRTPPTYFEALTVAAFAEFSRRQVELAIVEVGMGGRLDATNAAEPLLCVVTPIALDHREYLGETLGAIAGEKAGILRPEVPALSGPQEPEAQAALASAAARLGAALHAAAESVAVTGIESRGWTGQRIALRIVDEAREVELSLLGPHQADNLALAAAAAVELRGRGFPRLGADAIASGGAACRWPGRLEVIDLPGARRVVLDGAHNPAGIDRLTEFLRQIGEPVDLLFGALADKDVGAMLPRLARFAQELTLTAPPSPRALDPRDLATLVESRAARLERDPTAALEWALTHGDPSRPLLVCGSLYLIGDLRAELRRRYGVPAGLETI